MAIELTPQQQAALDHASGDPVAVVDPRTNTVYVLVSTQRFETLAENEEDDRLQRSIRDTAFRNAVRWADASRDPSGLERVRGRSGHRLPLRRVLIL